MEEMLLHLEKFAAAYVILGSTIAFFSSRFILLTSKGIPKVLDI